MKRLKYMALAGVAALFVVFFAQESGAQCASGSNCAPNRNVTRQSSHTYVRKEIRHNSYDASYVERQIRAKNYRNARSMRTNEEQTYHNPKDGSIFPGGRCSIPKGQCFKACKGKCGSPVKGDCDKCTKDCFSCKEAPKPKKTCNRCDFGSCTPMAVCPLEEDSIIDRTNYLKNYVTTPSDAVYDEIHKCKDLAAIELKHVDFRIKKDRSFTGFSNKLGNYRFRIFGCRRFDKTANLNQGRIMQKDLQFVEIFDNMLSDCYNITKTPNDLCLPENKKPLPEYVITAEITDFFMNLCDEFDWDKSQKEDSRKGSSEMTVTWRVMDVTGSRVFWQGETTGYGELEDGEYNGEMVLMERAFADAVNSLRNTHEFNEQLAQRVSPKDMEAKRLELIELEKIINPTKCAYEKEIKITKIERECGIKRICYDIDTCKGEVVSQEILDMEPKELGIGECSGLISSGNFVEEDGGSRSTASVYERQKQIEIDEKGGYQSSGSGSLDDGRILPSVEIINEIDEKGGYYSSGSGSLNENDEMYQRYINEIDERGGYNSSGSGAMLDNTDSIYDTYSQIDEAGNVTVSNSMFGDEIWVDIPLEDEEQQGIVEKSFVDMYSGLCIIDRPPYDELSPENLYKVRASIVNIKNVNGVEAAGLIVSDNFVMTSADIIVKSHNSYDLETINGMKFKGSAFRINPSKNIALIVLDSETKYTPLSLNLDLPAVGRNSFMTLGMLNFDDAEGRLDDKASIVSYRYSGDNMTSIVANTRVQKSTIGGVLIDKNGTISGMSNTKVKVNNNDLFIPISDALKSVGLRICDRAFPEQTKWYDRAKTPMADAIEKNKAKAPEAMKEKDRK